MHAYQLLLALGSGLFVYVVYQRIKNGQAITTSLLYVPLLLGVSYLFYRIWADGQRVAQLQTKVEQAKEREKDLKMQTEQAAVEAEKRILEAQLAQAENVAEELDDKLKVEKDRHEAFVERARGVRTWSDFWGAMGVGPGNEGPPGSDSGPRLPG